jgi:hypothetical protein
MMTHRLCCIITIFLLGSMTISCSRGRTSLEHETLVRVYDITNWLNDFMLVRSYYPDTIDEVANWRAQPLPDNPYTGQPMVDTGTTEFDPSLSPGNFHYIVIKRSEQNLAYQIFIFGDRGLIVAVNQGSDWHDLLRED